MFSNMKIGAKMATGFGILIAVAVILNNNGCCIYCSTL